MNPDIYESTPPTSYLEQYIQSYWRYQKDFRDGAIETIFPDSSYVLIWVNQGTLLVNGTEMPKLYVGGQATSPISLSAHGLVELWATRFLPWGFAPFADSRRIAAGSQIAASEVMGHEAASAIEAILSKATAETFPQALDDYFLDRILKSRFNDDFLRQATEYLIQKTGKSQVKQLAEYCGKSLRSLERATLKSTGRTPLQNISLLRFEHARNILMANPGTPIGYIVEREGYTDQSHLIKEFRKYAGMTPGQFADIFKDASKTFSWKHFVAELE